MSETFDTIPQLFPLSSFRITKGIPSLKFPENLLISENFASLLTPADGLRRLKNVHCLLMIAQQQKFKYSVILSLKEAETVRYMILTGQLPADRFSLCTQTGTNSPSIYRFTCVFRETSASPSRTLVRL